MQLYIATAIYYDYNMLYIMIIQYYRTLMSSKLATKTSTCPILFMETSDMYHIMTLFIKISL